MALLQPRFHSFSSIQERPTQGWDYCMTKAYCKWPAIAGIIIAIIVFILAIYCCIRCCRRPSRRSNRNRANTASMFNPAPYQGYQPANGNNATPPYNEPPRFAQFDVGHKGKPVGEDSLPAMPSWDAAQSKRIEEPGRDMEMGNLEPHERRPMLADGANASNVNLSHPIQGYAEADSHPVPGPYEVHGTQAQPPAGYTGPDFGHGAGHPYTGPDFGAGYGAGQQTAYSAYAPSESTRYEPSGVNEPRSPQESGTTYSNTMPPPSPSAQQQGFQHAPSVLQAGRRTAQGANSWRDV